MSLDGVSSIETYNSRKCRARSDCKYLQANLALHTTQNKPMVADNRKRLNPLPDDKILHSSKLKEFADDNFKFDENGTKLSKRVENTVGKGEIARYEQFLLFPQCFQKACFPERQKVSLCGNGLTLYQTTIS